MKTAAAFLLLVAVQAATSEPPESEWRPAAEKRILGRLLAARDLVLKCDFVINSEAGGNLTVPTRSKTTVVNFWRPSCGPCKPLLEQLAAVSKKAPSDLVILAAAEGGESHRGPIDIAAVREEIEGIVRKHGVQFPVCGYTDHGQTKRWQAEGVPLTLFYSRDGRLARVALGGDEGSRAVEQLEAGWRP